MEDAQPLSTSPVEISHLELDEPSTSQKAIITDMKHLASYNWIEAPTPTIAVPGSPSLWSPLEGPRQVKKHSGIFTFLRMPPTIRIALCNRCFANSSLGSRHLT